MSSTPPLPLVLSVGAWVYDPFVPEKTSATVGTSRSPQRMSIEIQLTVFDDEHGGVAAAKWWCGDNGVRHKHLVTAFEIVSPGQG